MDICDLMGKKSMPNIMLITNIFKGLYIIMSLIFINKLYEN